MRSNDLDAFENVSPRQFLAKCTAQEKQSPVSPLVRAPEDEELTGVFLSPARPSPRYRLPLSRNLLY